MTILWDYYNEFFHENRWWIICHLVITLIIFPLEIALFSIFSKRLFDSMEEKKHGKIFTVLLLFFMILLAIQFLYILKDLLDSKIIPMFETFVRSKMMHRVLQEPRNEDDVHIGEVVYNMNRLPTTLHHNYENVLKFVCPFFFGCAVFTAYVFTLEWRLGLMCLIFFITFFILHTIWFFKIHDKSIARITSENALMDQYEDTLINQENIHLANQMNEELELVDEANKSFEKTKFEEIQSINVFKIVSIVVICTFLFILFWYCYVLHKQSPYIMPLWKFIAFVTILILMTRTVVNLLSQSSKMIYHYGSVSNLDQFHHVFKDNEEEQIYDMEIDRTQLDMYLRDVSFSYTDKKKILDHLNLHVPFGTSCLITGTIGSGKSSLALILAGMIRGYSGEYVIGQTDMKRIHPTELRHTVTYMNQKNVLFDRTVAENIWYGQTEKPEDYVGVLTMIGCPQDLLDRVDEKVGKNGCHLSGGQKRLIFLLRCFFSDCPIVILDEPTANVDPATVTTVMKIVQEMKSRKTVMCISHDMTLTRYFQSIYIMENGQLHHHES